MRECDGRASGGHTRSPVTYPTADVYIQSQHRLSPRNLNGDRAAGSFMKKTPTTGKGSTHSWRRSRSVTIAKRRAANSSTIWYITHGLRMSLCVLYDS